MLQRKNTGHKVKSRATTNKGNQNAKTIRSTLDNHLANHQPTHRVYNPVPSTHYFAQPKGSLMPLQRLNKSAVELIESSKQGWLKQHNKMQHVKQTSDEWFAHIRERNAYMEMIIRVTGLTNYQAHDFVYSKTTIATFWLPDGSIRKGHEHK